MKEKLAKSPPEKFVFSAYKADDVRLALEQLFHGKCAYCESAYSAIAPVDVEHYRPKGRVEGQPRHGGYWWLAMDWQNLLPSCIDCNRRRSQALGLDLSDATLEQILHSQLKGTGSPLSGKQDAFPVIGEHVNWAPPFAGDPPNVENEQPLLLNPCDLRNPPEKHLTYRFDRDDLLGIILPAADATNDQGLSIRGRVSIQVLGLNRLALVQARTKILRRLQLLRYLALELFEIAEEYERREARVAKRASVDPADTQKDQEPSRKGSKAPRSLEGRNKRPPTSQRLRLLASRLIREIVDMGQPDQPYSSMVRLWIESFAGDVRTASKNVSKVSN